MSQDKSRSNLSIAKSEIKWFFKNHEVTKEDSLNLELDLNFQETFPLITKLVKKASITEFEMEKEKYRLYGWNTSKNNSCGWLCKLENYQSDLNLLFEHRLLTNTIGGIKEVWDEFDEIEKTDDFTLNQNFLFIQSMCSKGIGFNKDSYLSLCNKQDKKPLNNFDELIKFSQEANGNMTLYDSVNGEVYLHARNHYFDYVINIESQPEYTFYKIIGVKTFKDFVEKIAENWLSIIDGRG